MRLRSLFLALTFLSLPLLFSCSDDIDGPGDGAVPDYLTAHNTYKFRANNFGLTMTADGYVGEGFGIMTGRVPMQADKLVYRAGLWLSAEQDGQRRASIAWTGTSEPSNYSSVWNGESVGVYYVTEDSLSRQINNWPVEHGAPVDGQGNPLLYGDAMAWSALTGVAVAEAEILNHPLQDVRLTQALYAYHRNELERAVFLRYEITNLSDVALVELHLGFFADIDLDDGEEVWESGNSTGYDPDRSMSYTYPANFRGDNNAGYDAVPVTGITFLDVPQTGGQLVESHRIVRKGSIPDPEYSEGDMTQPVHALHALTGLSNTGAAMIDPGTSQPTMFAFTGDPVAQTGWLDVEADVRSLTNAGAISLAPGETKSITVLLCYAEGHRLSVSLTELNKIVDYIRAHPEFWNF